MKQLLTDKFQERFSSMPEVFTKAPGRLEILGNHTDYNEGHVLSAAIDRYMHIAAAPADGRQCTIWNFGLKQERVFSIDELDSKQPGDWANYIKGILVEFRKRGIQVPAFNAAISGDVPLSAGMSSSAAFEMACVLAFARLANAKLDWLEMAKIGQACENNYIGANTGLMDQFSSLLGKQDSLIYSDFRNYTAKSIPIPEGLTFAVINSMVKHVLTTEYNDRRNACNNAVQGIAALDSSVKALRDVPVNLLLRSRNILDGISFDCASHVVGEQIRVAQGISAMEHGDITEFGKLMFQSHDSSRYLFKNSCQELDTLVDIAASMPQCLGARLSGGGFGGITVHLVKSSDAEEYISSVSSEYEKRTGKPASAFICKAADGASYL